MKLKHLSTACAMAIGTVFGSMAFAGSGEVVLIQSGDIHGHLVPRPNVRSDSTGHLEGGLARMATVIQSIRENNLGKTIYVNTGDTVQGSGEALFTRGKALIDVVNMLGVEADAPGNWDFLYGPARFEETFKGTSTTPPLANWHAEAANLYYTNQFDDSAICAVTGKDSTGAVRPLKRVLPSYMVKTVNGVKVGILGFTTARAIAAISAKVTAGYAFTDGKTELPCYINVLRNTEQVDVIVMISELELGRDIKLAAAYPGVDVVLNSDMHEKTMQPIVVSSGSILVEEGQDGTMLGEMHLQVAAGHTTPGDGKLTWTWTPHIITDDIRENRYVAAKVKQVRAPFVTATFVPNQQVIVGGNTTTLLRPVDEVIAYTQLDLHRSNFMDEDMAGVVEGTSHDLIADGMRWAAGTDAAALRGFRYGTNVPAGWPITMEDIYHYIPIAAKLGRSPKACGYDLKFQAEQSTDGTFNADPTKWTGGWMFGYSNVSYDLDACAGYGIDGATGPVDRATNIKVGGVAIDITDQYKPSTQACTISPTSYSVAGYWYAEDPGTINNCAPCRGRLIQAVKTDDTTVDVAVPTYNATTATTTVAYTIPASTTLMDVSEAVVNYLRAPTSQVQAGLPGIGGLVTSSNLPIHRITVKRLPNINPFAFMVIQPLLGATAATCPPAP